MSWKQWNRWNGVHNNSSGSSSGQGNELSRDKSNDNEEDVYKQVFAIAVEELEEHTLTQDQVEDVALDMDEDDYDNSGSEEYLDDENENCDMESDWIAQLKSTSTIDQMLVKILLFLLISKVITIYMCMREFFKSQSFKLRWSAELWRSEMQNFTKSHIMLGGVWCDHAM